jgi:hypothetical protein
VCTSSVTGAALMPSVAGAQSMRNVNRGLTGGDAGQAAGRGHGRLFTGDPLMDLGACAWPHRVVSIMSCSASAGMIRAWNSAWPERVAVPEWLDLEQCRDDLDLVDRLRVAELRRQPTACSGSTRRRTGPITRR